MNLTEEQKQTVAKWAAEGAGLSDIQSRLADEFGIRLSYMETRFLILDLGAQIKDKEPEAAPAAREDQSAPASRPPNDDDDLDGAPQAASAAGVSVEISPIARPGFALAGAVVFSDGVKAEWGITNDGRFALDTGDPKYKPSAEDLREFQTQLRNQMAKRGY